MASGSGLPAADVVAVIPARFASQRFPGKLLADLGGRPVVAWVVDAVRRAPRVGTVLVATDHPEIARAAERAGAESVMTRPDHASGTDRIGEALADRPFAAVLNVQGDEPLIEPAHVDLLVQLLEVHPEAGVSTLATAMDEHGLADRNVVKVVRAQSGRALYFSRGSVPGLHPDDHPSRAVAASPLRHVGVYGYRAGAFELFRRTPASPLERREGLEQLRLLEAGIIYQVGVIEVAGPGVDTPEDLEACRRWLTGSDPGAPGPQRVG